MAKDTQSKKAHRERVEIKEGETVAGGARIVPETESRLSRDCPVPNGVLLVIGGSEAKSESPEKKVQENSDDTLEISEPSWTSLGKKIR